MKNKNTDMIDPEWQSENEIYLKGVELIFSNLISSSLKVKYRRQEDPPWQLEGAKKKCKCALFTNEISPIRTKRELFSFSSSFFFICFRSNHTAPTQSAQITRVVRASPREST